MRDVTLRVIRADDNRHGSLSLNKRHSKKRAPCPVPAISATPPSSAGKLAMLHLALATENPGPFAGLPGYIELYLPGGAGTIQGLAAQREISGHWRWIG